jgi:hypothetical protein
MGKARTPTQKAPRDLVGFVGYLFKEIWRQRKWSLLPLWVLLAAIALGLLLGGGSSSILPAIYVTF